RRCLDPWRAVRGALLLVEELALDTVRIALQCERAPAQVREERRSDLRVVLDHVALGEADARVHDLVEVREPQLPSLDRDLDAPARELAQLAEHSGVRRALRFSP